MDATAYESVRDEALNWLSSVCGQTVSSTTDLKSGVILCNTINTVRPGAIPTVNTQTATFRQFENIDKFLKAVEALGVSPDHKFYAEDLFYENNIPKVILTIVAFSQAIQGSFSAPEISADLEELKAYAATTQKADGKQRASSESQLSLFEMGAKKSQAQASAASRQGDRMILSTEKSVDFSGRLGFIDEGTSSTQKMISAAKTAGDKIIMSKETAIASGELGMIDSSSMKSQKMISGAKTTADSIILSKETAVASPQLGLLDAHVGEHQKMVSGAKLSGDKICRLKD